MTFIKIFLWGFLPRGWYWIKRINGEYDELFFWNGDYFSNRLGWRVAPSEMRLLVTWVRGQND